MRRAAQAAMVVLALVATSMWGLAVAPQPASADAPNLTSGYGITVGGWRWISTRTLEVDISTAKVSANAVIGPHRVRITFPNDYFSSGATRYPVLYLLHGGAGGNSAQWTTGGGAVEPLTDGKPLITVMPDGGKVGWYTDWVDQSQGAQNWRDFHIDQLVPWIDANLRTIATKQGRAIAGLSMGGFGAVRYAEDRPDLFAFVGSFSGALDLGDSGTRSVVTEQAVQYGFSGNGPFGNPFWPNDKTWNALNPLARAGNLRGVSVALYAGGGSNDQDVLEGTMRAAADRMKAALDTAGVPAFYWMYGRPGPSAPFGCDGGHNFGCWNFALLDAIPRMLAVLQTPSGPPPAQPAVGDGGFESPGMAWWSCTSGCGTDYGAGLAHTGIGDGWVRNNSGWNDIHQVINVLPNHTYTVRGWVRTSANNTAGYFGLRTVGGQVLGEQAFGELDGYTQLSVTVNVGNNSSAVVYGGLWAVNGDTWMQLDDVSAS